MGNKLMQNLPAAVEPTADPLDARPGDIVMLFRLQEGGTASPLGAQYAILAALRQAGLLPADESVETTEAEDIADFIRHGSLHRPIVRRFGRLEGWH
ncbi:hypothetical protein [Nocardia sp. NPDC052566]|uniref:hypothetical protein n=1 Tax=Nocardia sp. NPDC052566 TaxID=3364330 RepID=UPI0037C8D8FF